jgi:hypothetical protein
MEDHHRRLNAMHAFYKQTILDIARDAIIDDWRWSFQPPRPPRFACIRRVLGRLDRIRGIPGQFAAFVRQKLPLRRRECTDYARAMAIIARNATFMADVYAYADPAMAKFTVTIVAPNNTTVLALPEHPKTKRGGKYSDE